jgi:hypothetical protein
LLEETLARLRQEFVNAGKPDLFESLKGSLIGEGTPSLTSGSLKSLA